MSKSRKGFSDPNLFGFKVAMIVITVIMTLGFMAYLILYLNITAIHTPNYPPAGEITSERYTLHYWLITLAVTQILLIGAALATAAFGGKSDFCSGFWMFWFILLVIAYAVFFIVLVFDAKNCNGPDQPGNLCHHMLRCCDPAFNALSTSGCFGPTTCVDLIPKFPDIVLPITVATLGWNDDFVILFWATLAFVALDLILVVLVWIVRSWGPSGSPRNKLDEAYSPLGTFKTQSGVLIGESVSKKNISTNARKRIA